MRFSSCVILLTDECVLGPDATRRLILTCRRRLLPRVDQPEGNGISSIEVSKDHAHEYGLGSLRQLVDDIAQETQSGAVLFSRRVIAGTCEADRVRRCSRIPGRVCVTQWRSRAIHSCSADCASKRTMAGRKCEANVLEWCLQVDMRWPREHRDTPLRPDGARASGTSHAAGSRRRASASASDLGHCIEASMSLTSQVWLPVFCPRRHAK